MVTNQFSLLKGYKFAKNYIVEAGFGDEIEWQKNLHFEDIKESDFLRESAWVILCAGMKESVIRKYFRDITFCFFEWESAEKIVKMRKYCVEYALEIFNNLRKINAIAETAQQVFDIGFNKLKTILQDKSIETLLSFPFMGPVTSYHLAKNLGIPVAKADRHLVRLASSLGYTNVQEFCADISKESKEPISVVDIVLWRFATLKRDYICKFLLVSSQTKGHRLIKRELDLSAGNKSQKGRSPNTETAGG